MTSQEIGAAAGVDVIYLDNAATTFPKPEKVYVAADKFYRHYGGNAGRGNNPLARTSSRLLAETRERLSEWLGASSAQSVIFAPSSTHALNLAIFGADLKAGEIVYVTPFDHNSMLRPVEHLRKVRSIEVRQIPFARQTYTCQLDKLAAMFQSEPPAMVCMGQASNVCGVMPPIVEIAQLVKRSNPNAKVIIDGSQTAGFYPLPLAHQMIDAFIFSGHKALYGPFGVAGLVLSSDWRPTPLLYGGTGTRSESVEMPLELPSVYEAGSINIWAIAGLYAALEWLGEVGRETILEHTLSMAKQLRNILISLPGSTVYMPPEGIPWCGIISFALENMAPQAIETALGAKGIAVRAGLHCAPWAHRWLGTINNGGTVRFSAGYFNNEGELDKVGQALQDLLQV